MKKIIISAAFTLLLGTSFAGAQSYSFNTDLTLGSRHSDVANLQTWLMSNGFDIPAVRTGLTAKGYFGTQTKSALMRYQTSVGLLASGYFGPLTRAKIRAGGTQQPLPPQSNALRIVSPNGGEVWQKQQYQQITWTGSPGIMAQTGRISLLSYSPPCADQTTTGVHCMIAVRAPILIVSNANLSTGSYNWNIGATYVDYCPTCGAPAPISDGQYKIQICSADSSVCDESDNYFTITSAGAPTPSPYPNPTPIPSPLSPVISGIDAPTTLQTGQVGTWGVHAVDPQNGTLNYTVDWGDVVYNNPYSSNTSSSGQFVQTTTFTHSYNSPGVYTITFTVRSSYGLSAVSKATVSVGTGNLFQPITVVSPNGGEMWKRGTNQSIRWTNLSSYYPYSTPTGYVRITLDYQCPSNQYCTALYRPPYVVQSSAPNGGSSAWLVGSVTTDGVNASQAPAGTYVMTICKFDNGQQSGCDSSDSYFTIVD